MSYLHLISSVSRNKIECVGLFTIFPPDFSYLCTMTKIESNSKKNIHLIIIKYLKDNPTHPINLDEGDIMPTLVFKNRQTQKEVFKVNELCTSHLLYSIEIINIQVCYRCKCFDLLFTVTRNHNLCV